MYLTSQSTSQPSVLQLTGQLTIMAHPAHLQHRQHLPQYTSIHYEQPTHTQHLPPSQIVRSSQHGENTAIPSIFPSRSPIKLFPVGTFSTCTRASTRGEKRSGGNTSQASKPGEESGASREYVFQHQQSQRPNLGSLS